MYAVQKNNVISTRFRHIEAVQEDVPTVSLSFTTGTDDSVVESDDNVVT